MLEKLTTPEYQTLVRNGNDFEKRRSHYEPLFSNIRVLPPDGDGLIEIILPGGFVYLMGDIIYLAVKEQGELVALTKLMVDQDIIDRFFHNCTMVVMAGYQCNAVTKVEYDSYLALELAKEVNPTVHLLYIQHKNESDERFKKKLWDSSNGDFLFDNYISVNFLTSLNKSSK